MGTDDLFKKRREKDKKRKYGHKTPKANSFLIVTEGKETEPNYFKGLKKEIEDKLGGVIDVVTSIDIEGQGCSTAKLIEKAEEIVKKSPKFYQNVWVVFDKDDFSDFDKAISLGESKGFHVAWSNQSFEYWVYLHFEYSDVALHRTEWIKKLDDIFKEKKILKGSYQKNIKNLYDVPEQHGSVEKAIKNAERRMKGLKKGDKPSKYDPGTTVHLLVKELKKYLEE